MIIKYVDDLFFIIPSEKLNHIHKLLNEYHEKLQFTVEKEKDRSLPFLDVLIVVKNDVILYDWYQKETSSGRLLNFYSHHPKHQVLNTAKNFIHRVLNLSSDIYHNKNKEKIINILLDNNFSKKNYFKIN